MTSGSIDTIHEVLVAWQAGRLSSRRAMLLCGVDHLSALYEAAQSSGVPLRKTFLPREMKAAERAANAIQARASRKQETAPDGP